jgi:hypoxanthine-DNA glycosylase
MRARAKSIVVSRGFPPVLGPAPRILLLGSLPGQVSIAAGEYYAQPRNAFWIIMNALCAAGPDLDYAKRVAALKRAGVALWDVLHAAERPGSLDSNIVSASVEVNDIARLLARHRTITLIGFNGQKAAEIFRRHIEPELPPNRIAQVTLPSTSPAYASLHREQKLKQWRKALAPHLGAR